MRGAAALLLLAATAGAQAADPVSQGRELAEGLCARCHAIAGPGPSPVAEAPPFSSFAQRWPLESLAEAFAEGIAVGHKTMDMPEFTFEPPQIGALLAYLRSVQE